MTEMPSPLPPSATSPPSIIATAAAATFPSAASFLPLRSKPFRPPHLQPPPLPPPLPPPPRPPPSPSPPSFPFLLTLDDPLRRRCLPLLRLLPFSLSFLLTLESECNTSPPAKRRGRSGSYEGERAGVGACASGACAVIAGTGATEHAQEDRERQPAATGGGWRTGGVQAACSGVGTAEHAREERERRRAGGWRGGSARAGNRQCARERVRLSTRERRGRGGMQLAGGGQRAGGARAE